MKPSQVPERANQCCVFAVPSTASVHHKQCKMMICTCVKLHGGMLIYLHGARCLCCICTVAAAHVMSYARMHACTHAARGVRYHKALFGDRPSRTNLLSKGRNARQMHAKCTQLRFAGFVVFVFLGDITRYYIVYYEHNLIERIRLLQEADLIHCYFCIQKIIPHFYLISFDLWGWMEFLQAGV